MQNSEDQWDLDAEIPVGYNLKFVLLFWWLFILIQDFDTTLCRQLWNSLATYIYHFELLEAYETVTEARNCSLCAIPKYPES